MEELQIIEQAVSIMTELTPSGRKQVIVELLREEAIDIPLLVSLYASELQAFKRNARQDICTIAQAGAMLAEKEIKQIPKIKSIETRQLRTAQANTLLSTKAHEGTIFKEKLSRYIDMDIVDRDWYEQWWELKTINPSIRAKENI